MGENSWVLRGVDAAARQRAVEEAERRGLSLADYLTEVVQQGAPAEPDEFDALLEAAPPDAAALDEAMFASPPEPNFAVRHRLEVLERRLGLAVGGLDSALHALDSSVYGLAARVDETEALAVNTAVNATRALQELSGSLAALRKRLSDTEDAAETLIEANDAAHAEFDVRCSALDRRLNAVEDIARGADAAAAALTDAHEALKFTIADEFAALARESAARLSAGLSEVSAAADAAAAQADAAAAHLIEELRALRASIDERLAESAAETRGRMHAAFADAADRLGALAERVVDHERLTARTAEQLRAQIVDVEDGAQSALEEASEALRQVDAQLAADIVRVAEDGRMALTAAHAELGSEVSELRERHEDGLARFKLVDAALSNTISDVAALRETLDQRSLQTAGLARAALSQAQSDWDARFDALAVRTAAAEREAAHTREALGADIVRVEACTLAALEKLGGDVAALDAGLGAKLERAAQAADVLIGHVNEHIEAELSEVREQHLGALARLKLLEAAAGRAETEQALAVLQQQVSLLAVQVEAQRVDESVAQRVEYLRARLAACETQLGESVDRVHDVARVVGRLATQNADASTQSEERLHRVEQALIELQPGGSFAPAEDAAGPGPVQALEHRVGELEQRQAQALETLRADIAHFIGENDRRLAALEGPAPPADIAAEFNALRRRVEERILGVEMRSVRTLEQVADTVALIEKRFTNPGQAETPAAKSA
jgi:localization factor PodJL